MCRSRFLSRTCSSLPQLLSIWLLCFQFMNTVSAQDSGRPMNKQYQWQFKEEGFGDTLPTCLPLGIRVKSFNTTLNDTFGIPPYYMISLAVGGLPVTTLLGTTNDTLSYTITQPVGSELLLDVTDSTGSAGGLPPRLFKVIAGQSTQCVVTPPPNPDFVLTANVTGDLQTCQQWGLRIKGGVPPYNLTLAAPNSPVVTNVSIPLGFDAYTYVNRADPNGQLVAAVSDFTGRWASGTPIVNTKGSTDTLCTGIVGGAGNATRLDQLDRERAAAANKKNTGLIVGITIPLVLLFIAAVVFGVYFYRRRQRQQAEREKQEQDLLPRQYQYEELPFNSHVRSDSVPENAFNSNSNISRKGGQGPPPPVAPPPPGAVQPIADDSGVIIYRIPVNSSLSSQTPLAPGNFQNRPHSPSTSDTNTNTSSGISGGGANPALQNRPSFASFPRTPVRRSGKAAEAAQNSQRRPSESDYPADHEGAATDATTPILSSHNLSTGSGGTSGPIVREEIIIQHRDGEINVRELPPPYADRTAAAAGRSR